LIHTKEDQRVGARILAAFSSVEATTSKTMIEQKIDELISALSANTAALRLLAAGPAAPSEQSSLPAKTAPKKAAGTAPEPGPTPAPTPSAPPAPAKAEISEDVDRLADIKAVNAEMGITKITAAPPEKRAEVLAKLNAALAKATAVSDAV
jgi:hypothetical protein